MYPEVNGPGDYKKSQEAIKKAFESAAKKEPTEILKKQAKKMKSEMSEEVKKKCEMTHMVVREGIEMYEKGEMTYDEFVDDLSKSLKAISGMKNEE